jgi:hypothetical protein
MDKSRIYVHPKTDETLGITELEEINEAFEHANYEGSFEDFISKEYVFPEQLYPKVEMVANEKKKDISSIDKKIAEKIAKKDLASQSTSTTSTIDDKFKDVPSLKSNLFASPSPAKEEEEKKGGEFEDPLSMSMIKSKAIKDLPIMTPQGLVFSTKKKINVLEGGSSKQVQNDSCSEDSEDSEDEEYNAIAKKQAPVVERNIFNRVHNKRNNILEGGSSSLETRLVQLKNHQDIPSLEKQDVSFKTSDKTLRFNIKSSTNLLTRSNIQSRINSASKKTFVNEEGEGEDEAFAERLLEKMKINEDSKEKKTSKSISTQEASEKMARHEIKKYLLEDKSVKSDWSSIQKELTRIAPRISKGKTSSKSKVFDVELLNVITLNESKRMKFLAAIAPVVNEKIIIATPIKSTDTNAKDAISFFGKLHEGSIYDQIMPKKGKKEYTNDEWKRISDRLQVPILGFWKGMFRSKSHNEENARILENIFTFCEEMVIDWFNPSKAAAQFFDERHLENTHFLEIIDKETLREKVLGESVSNLVSAKRSNPFNRASKKSSLQNIEGFADKLRSAVDFFRLSKFGNHVKKFVTDKHMDTVSVRNLQDSITSQMVKDGQNDSEIGGWLLLFYKFFFDSYVYLYDAVYRAQGDFLEIGSINNLNAAKSAARNYYKRLNDISPDVTYESNYGRVEF